MTPAQWVWKLAHTAHGVPNVWLAVDERNRPVCQYAGIPRQVRLGGRDHPVMVAVDAMTAPASRRLGVLTSVVECAHAAWRAAGVTFVLGLPNEQWGSRRTALGWQPVTSLRWLTRPLRPEALLARRIRWRGLSRLSVAGTCWNRWCDRGSGRARGVVHAQLDRVHAADVFDRVSRERDSSGYVTLRRDSQWMTRRLFDRPASPYGVVVAHEGARPRGYAAYQIQRVGDRRVGTVTDLVTRPPHGRVGRGLIRETVGRLRSEGADTAIALAVPGAPDHRLLRRAGFLFSRGSFTVDVVLLDANLRIETLRAARWMLRGSDFDLI